MKIIGKEVNKIVGKIFQKKDPVLAELIVNWPSIVGTKFSSRSYPIKISSSKEKGVRKSLLMIGVENSSLSMEMSFQQDIIIERIAVYLGYKAIHKIRIVVRS